MPVDDAFFHHDMAALYDSFNRHGRDSDFYLGLPAGQSTILDLGCGTGSVTLELARLGHTVTGLDPAPGMLGIARSKDTERLVDWVHADAMDFSLGKTFDLILMTGHVFQVFLTDEEALAVLHNARRHLAPGGRLAFESRNPSARAWEGWNEEQTREEQSVAGIGPVKVHYQVKDVTGEHVTFDAVFGLAVTGERRVSESTLRFPNLEIIETLLAQAGFTGIDRIGDWDHSPFTYESKEIIVIAHA